MYCPKHCHNDREVLSLMNKNTALERDTSRNRSTWPAMRIVATPNVEKHYNELIDRSLSRALRFGHVIYDRDLLLWNKLTATGKNGLQELLATKRERKLMQRDL